MSYAIWVGLAVALLMTAVAPAPGWWMILGCGIGANGLVLAANGWKMPVLGRIEEGIRHRSMDSGTRHKWLGDVIPTGFGKASVGDLLIAAGFMGAWAHRGGMEYSAVMLLASVAWWVSGWVKGFRLFDDEKWPAEVRRDARKNLPLVAALMLIGNLLNVRGCSIGELHASAEAVKAAMMTGSIPKLKTKPDEAKWRDLGKLAPLTPSLLTRLKLDSAANAREGKARADEEAKRKAFNPKKAFEREERRIEAKAHPAFEREQKQAEAVWATIINFPGFTVNCNRSGNCAVADRGKVFMTVDGNMFLPSTHSATTSTGFTIMMSGVAMQPVGTRKGPFCRVTCTFACHNPQSQGNGTADAETDAEYCKQQHIPDDAVSVMGWVDAGNGQEFQDSWPGPAQEPGALKYKLYWK